MSCKITINCSACGKHTMTLEKNTFGNITLEDRENLLNADWCDECEKKQLEKGGIDE